MRINKRLNLVIPLDDTEQGTVYVHSTPISREVFERYFLVLSKTFAAIYGEGLSIMSGPRVAALLLRKVAEEAGVWDGLDGVQRGLMAEIRRLTNVVMVDPDPGSQGGWVTMPWQDVIDRKMLDEEDVSEAEGVVVFFIVGAAVHRRDQLPAILDGMTRLWGAQTSLLNSTEYANSLPRSIETSALPETVAPEPAPTAHRRPRVQTTVTPPHGAARTSLLPS